MKTKLELLSPARDMESVKAAIMYGADSLYLGGSQFGLRANVGFDDETLSKAVQHAHAHGKKVYLTCNIIADNSDIDNFPEYLKRVSALGVDAFIVSDLGLLELIKSNSNTVVHISTQAGVTNYATANMLYKLGAKRVILARETSLEQIKRIRDETPPELEIETFVHGAMCMAFSGRCLISSYLTQRNANRGECAQPCRWGYHLMEETRPDEFFPIYEDERGSYIFNSKDLCMVEHIGELVRAGVDSFKIEGRAKTAYYSAVVTNAYRAAIEAHLSGKPVPDWVSREVNCVSHRPYYTGFYFGGSHNNSQNYAESGYIRDCDFVGVVTGFENGGVVIERRNRYTLEDELEIVIPGSPPEKFNVSKEYPQGYFIRKIK